MIDHELIKSTQKEVDESIGSDRFDGLSSDLMARIESEIDRVQKNYEKTRLYHLKIKKSKLYRVVEFVQRLSVIASHKYIYNKICGIIMDALYKKKFKNAWIISDRVEEAADNGIVFYRYITKNHNNINAFYVISDKSNDFIKLKDEGVRLIAHGTLMHRMAMRYATVEVSAFFNFSQFNVDRPKSSKRLKRAFILHGMDQSDLSEHYERLNVDLYCTSIKFAYDFYRQGHSIKNISTKNIALTGMPRYDVLSNIKDKKNRDTIVIAPTWRRFLLYKPNSTIEQDESVFLDSYYYKIYNNLFNSRELSKLSKAYRVVFIPHPELLGRVSDFKLPNFIKIKTYSDLKTSGLYDLALRTELFITDFSSTVFDFAFLGSNVVHFSFDSNDYYSPKHDVYKSWFDLDSQGLGPSITNIGDLKKYLKNGNWVNNRRIVKDAWNNVPKNSSEIIYNEILKITN